jgi:hypothetical protein
MIEKILKIPCVVFVWYMYFALVAQAISTGNIKSLIVSIVWLLAILMIFPPFRKGKEDYDNI